MSHEAQRDLEQRALRNVRGLLDRMEATEHKDKRTQRTLVVAIVVGGAFILATIFFVASHQSGTPPGRVVDLPSPKPGQVMPQAPRAPQ